MGPFPKGEERGPNGVGQGGGGGQAGVGGDSQNSLWSPDLPGFSTQVYLPVWLQKLGIVIQKTKQVPLKSL